MASYAHLLCLWWTFSNAYANEILDSCDNATTPANDNHDPVCIALNDERTFPDTFYITALAPVVVGISGALSALGSLLIMFIILRSSFRLSTVSHRLVFAMSLADLIASIGMGAGTLPMPKDTVYDFQGAHLGNEFTCSSQGFMIFFGAIATICYSACLSVYFMCTITFRMKDATFRKCIEPFMYISCLLLTLPTAIMIWANKWYNPTPFEPFCVAMSYPYYCKSEMEDAERCSIRGKPNLFQIQNRKNLTRFYLVLFYAIPFVTLSSMVTITLSVCLQERGTRTTNQRINRRNKGKDLRQRHAYTKAIASQAFAYVLASITIQVFAFVRSANNTNHTLQLVYTALRPCQGLLNFMVFFSQKVSNARQIDPSLSYKKAAIHVLVAREKHHFQLSGISLIDDMFRDNNDVVVSVQGYDDNEKNGRGVCPDLCNA